MNGGLAAGGGIELQTRVEEWNSPSVSRFIKFSYCSSETMLGLMLGIIHGHLYSYLVDFCVGGFFCFWIAFVFGS